MEEEKTAINWLVSNIYHLNFFINKNYRKMQRQSIIVFIQGDRVETYGNLKKCCDMEGLKYWALSRLKFPIRTNDVVIHKTSFK
jgi:hypothetical protein